jgi:hypothetical protein
MKEPKICIGMCSIGEVLAETVWPLVHLLKHPHVTEYVHIVGTLLPHARNDIIKKMRRDEETGRLEATHLLMLDADMCGFIPAHLDSMIARDVDIVSGVCTQRRPPYSICVNLDDPNKIIQEIQSKPKAEDREPIEVNYSGFGFILIKTDVIEELTEQTSDGPIWFSLDRWPRKTIFEEFNELLDKFQNERKDEVMKKFGEEVLKLGTMSHLGTAFIGEDIGFCMRARAQGFRVWIDPNVIIKHIGPRKYDLRDTIKWQREQKSKDQKISKNQSSLSELDEAEQALLPIF